MTEGIRYPGERLPRLLRRAYRLIALALASRSPMLVPAALGLTASRRVELRIGGAIYSLGSRPLSELWLDLGILWEVCLAEVYPIPADSPLAIVDIGAHRGHFTVWAARRRVDAEIHAYEPDAANANECEAAVRRAGLAGRVVVHREAVAARDGLGRFRRAARSDAGSLADLGSIATGASARSKANSSVTTVGLATVLARCRTSTVFLKMDAEGAEHEAFAALASDAPVAAGRIAAAALEWHPPDANDVDVRRSLAALGFEVRFRPLRIGNGIVHAHRPDIPTS